MKNIKFKLGIILMGSLLSIPVYANTITETSTSTLANEISTEYLEAVRQGKIEGASITIITEEEYVEALAEEKNITISEAQELNDMNSEECLEKMN